jgi:hypothetical protein
MESTEGPLSALRTPPFFPIMRDYRERYMGHNCPTKTGGAMRELEVLRRLLEEAFEEAKSVNHEYGQEWSAGRQAGAFRCHRDAGPC